MSAQTLSLEPEQILEHCLVSTLGWTVKPIDDKPTLWTGVGPFATTLQLPLDLPGPSRVVFDLYNPPDGAMTLFIRWQDQPHWSALSPTFSHRMPFRRPGKQDALTEFTVSGLYHPGGAAVLEIRSCLSTIAGIRAIRVEPCEVGQLPPEKSPVVSDDELIVLGINDQNDSFTCFNQIDKRDIACNLYDHQQAGFNTVCWMAYAGICLYPTEVGTRIRKNKKWDDPTLFGWQMYEQFDTHEIGLKIAHELGLKFYPWFRMQNEFNESWAISDNPLHDASSLHSDFMLENPQFLRQFKSGQISGGMGYHHKAVRDYRLAIIRECVERYPASDGIMLDLHRHAPMDMYDEVDIQEYKRLYGIDVRAAEPIDQNYEDPRWYKLRSRHFTGFMRELKAMLASMGRSDLTVAARVGYDRDNALSECADLELWCQEKLVDHLVLECQPDYRKVNVPDVLPIARAAGIKVIASFAYAWPKLDFGDEVDLSGLLAQAQSWRGQGADGVAFYESDAMITMPPYRGQFADWVRQLAGR